MRRLLSIVAAFSSLAATSSTTRSAATLAYAPAPPDNPLKGFVPYLGSRTNFPHSLEWDYTQLSELMTGPTNSNWAPLEAKLDAAASRGHQFFARFYLEWPGRKTGVPQFLIDEGLTMRSWTNTNADNHTRGIGYHDDSFAWATVHTGKPGDSWFFETRLRSAHALDKWRTQPIGGEVRPEVWPCLFDEPGCAPPGQEFDRCVALTHASWLCNEGVFRGKNWKMTGILPGEPPACWSYQADTRPFPPSAYHLLLRVPNPLPNGPPVRFANQAQDRQLRGWLTLGETRW
jgi:hypothetical protein